MIVPPRFYALPRASRGLLYCLSLAILGSCGEPKASETRLQKASSELVLQCFKIEPKCVPDTNGCVRKAVCINGSWQCEPYGSVVCGEECGEGFSATCYSSGGLGPCMKSCGSQCGGGYSQTCPANGTGTATPCQPATAITEICNGCDEDRDGKVDNAAAMPLSQPCVLGECQTQRICISGSWSACGKEVCNGLDDNCDGRFDEADVCKTNSDSSCCIPIVCTPSMTGTYDDKCGGSITCGPACFLLSCGGKCGRVSNGCGGMMTCPSCPFPQTCIFGVCQ